MFLKNSRNFLIPLAASASKHFSTVSVEASNSANNLGAIVNRSQPVKAKISPLFPEKKLCNEKLV